MAFLQRVFGVRAKSPAASDSAMGVSAEPSPVHSPAPVQPSSVQPSNAQSPPTGGIPFAAAVDAVPALDVTNSASADFALDDFQILRTLGTGSFGRVLLAQHRATGAYYAVKKLRKADVVRLRQVEHTNNERALLAQVAHPFLVRLAGTFQDARHLYLVLEYVGGGELFSLLRKVKTLPPFVAQFYAAEVLLALEYLHERNIVYRDLKPENILIAADGHVCLTDFGFAKTVVDLTYTLCGTPDYLAPEIVQSRGYGRAVDVYALGVLIYEMLLGAPPFYEETPARLYENIVRMAPRFPPGFDPVARELLEGLLEKNPEARLGALAGGLGDVRRHAWFRSVQWELLAERRIRAPYRPTIAHAGDASNFDEYPEEEGGGANGDEPCEVDGLFPHF